MAHRGQEEMCEISSATRTPSAGALTREITAKHNNIHFQSATLRWTSSTMAILKTPPVLRVAVVGGGPGGLATAIALQAVPNVEVTVYERATLLCEVGAGISISHNTWNVLDLLGVAGSLTSGHHTTTVLNMCARDI